MRVFASDGHLYGGGGLISTVSDLATFYRALFRGEVFDRRRTLDTMTKVSGPGRDDAAAMGIFVLDVDGERCFSHPGYWATEATYCRNSTSRSPARPTRPTTTTSTPRRSSG